MANLEDLVHGAFASVDLATWQERVAAESGGRPASALAGTTTEGLVVEPLYAAGGEAVPAPGVPPFVRGPLAGRRRILRLASISSASEVSALDADAADGFDFLINGGSEELDLQLVLAACSGARPRSLLLDGHGWIGPRAIACLEQWRASGGDTRDLEVAIAGDALSAFARHGVAVDSEAQLVELIEAHAGWAEVHAPRIRTAIVSTHAYHEAGAGEAQELGLGLAAGVWHLRALMAGGLSLERALGHVGFSVAVGSDVFTEVAKMRALRWTWARVASAIEGAPVRAPWIHAETSLRTLSKRDPWTNMLRGTNQTIAAILGGVDAVTTRAFDEAVGSSNAVGARLARNTATILLEESHLADVVDPVGGSYYVEALTESLARAAWQTFQAIEAAGGLYQALEKGVVAAAIEPVAAARATQIATRKQGILGVSEYANLSEAKLLGSPRLHQVVPASPPPSKSALPLRRDAEPYEALRDRVESMAFRPEVGLMCLGAVAEYTARANFAENFFATAGIGVTVQVAPDSGWIPIPGATIPRLACLAGADAAYAGQAEALARALKKAGVEEVWLAGRGGDHEAAYRAAGIDRFIHLGCDVLAAVTAAVACFGVKS